ncbi:MAG: tetratricopeptide repeat protein [Bacteroidales bacterium]
MKRNFLKSISLFLPLLFISFTLEANDNESWERGRNLYIEGSYQESLEHFVELEERGFLSWQLLYNIGNCHFKLNNLGSSILYYERALKLNPTNSDILYNLEFAKRFTVDRLESVPEFVLKSWFRKINYSLSSNRWAYISLFAIALTVLSFLGFRYGPNRRVRKWLFFLSLLLLLVFILSSLFSVTQKSRYYNNSEAIVFSSVMSVKNSPDQFGSTLFILHEGTKVIRVEQLEEWSKIIISDGREGWVATQQLEFI